jgi:hypothetical protein
LKDNFIKFIPRREPHQHLLLISDGHKSHISVDLIDWAKEQKIILFVLPAHTSHILQRSGIILFPGKTKYGGIPTPLAVPHPRTVIVLDLPVVILFG